MKDTALIIAAAGQGSRMGRPQNKQFIKINNQEILLHTLKRLALFRDIGQVIVLHHPEEKEVMMALLNKAQLSFNITYVEGGDSRQQSVYNGLKAVESHLSKVIIHDGARPLITEAMMMSAQDFLLELNGESGFQGAFFGVAVKDTIKRKVEATFETLDRSSLYAVQTPQIFLKKPLMLAHEQAFVDGFLGTDDCSLIEREGGHIKVLAGDYKNIKVTTPEDLVLAEAFIKSI